MFYWGYFWGWFNPLRGGVQIPHLDRPWALRVERAPTPRASVLRACGWVSLLSRAGLPVSAKRRFKKPRRPLVIKHIGTHQFGVLVVFVVFFIWYRWRMFGIGLKMASRNMSSSDSKWKQLRPNTRRHEGNTYKAKQSGRQHVRRPIPHTRLRTGAFSQQFSRSETQHLGLESTEVGFIMFSICLTRRETSHWFLWMDVKSPLGWRWKGSKHFVFSSYKVVGFQPLNHHLRQKKRKNI